MGDPKNYGVDWSCLSLSVAEMGKLRTAASIGRDTARGFREPRLHQNISMTLDKDDLAVARHWLAHRNRWDDGNVITAYEREFAKWNGSRFAFAFQAGRKALSACIVALELRPGDEVIVPAFTCVVVANAFRYQKINSVFCDIELETYGPDIDSIRQHVNSKTRAIVIQHSFGLVCRDYDAIIELGQKNDLKIIEDAAHSTGATLHGRKVGTRGDVGFYSSEHSKIFNTVVGGVAVTDDAEIARRLDECTRRWDLPSATFIEAQLLNVELDYYRFKHPWSRLLYPLVRRRNGGSHIVSTTEAEIRGDIPAEYFTRMAPPIAALGLNQLPKIDVYNAIRQSTAKKWDRWCRDHGYIPPTVINGSEPVYLRYPVSVDASMKSDTSWAREQLGVELGVWFTANLHPAQTLHGFPRADFAVKHCVNFPTILYDKS